MPKLNVITTTFRPFHRGTLRGFCTVYIPELHLVVHHIAVHESANGVRWVQLPAKPMLNDDGTTRRTRDGRIDYARVINFTDRATNEAFSARVVDALLKFDPAAFGETAGASSET